MGTWKVIVEKIDNGYIVRGLGGDRIMHEVVEEREGEDEPEIEQNAIRDVLWLMSEYFGIINSKHDRTQLVLEVKKTDDL